MSKLFIKFSILKAEEIASVAPVGYAVYPWYVIECCGVQLLFPWCHDGASVRVVRGLPRTADDIAPEWCEWLGSRPSWCGHDAVSICARALSYYLELALIWRHPQVFLSQYSREEAADRSAKAARFLKNIDIVLEV